MARSKASAARADAKAAQEARLKARLAKLTSPNKKIAKSTPKKDLVTQAIEAAKMKNSARKSAKKARKSKTASPAGSPKKSLTAQAIENAKKKRKTPSSKSSASKAKKKKKATPSPKAKVRSTKKAVASTATRKVRSVSPKRKVTKPKVSRKKKVEEAEPEFEVYEPEEAESSQGMVDFLNEDVVKEEASKGKKEAAAVTSGVSKVLKLSLGLALLFMGLAVLLFHFTEPDGGLAMLGAPPPRRALGSAADYFSSSEPKASTPASVLVEYANQFGVAALVDKPHVRFLVIILTGMGAGLTLGVSLSIFQ